MWVGDGKQGINKCWPNSEFSFIAECLGYLKLGTNFIRSWIAIIDIQKPILMWQGKQYRGQVIKFMCPMQASMLT